MLPAVSAGFCCVCLVWCSSVNTQQLPITPWLMLLGLLLRALLSCAPWQGRAYCHDQEPHLSMQLRTVWMIPSFHCLSFFFVLFRCTAGQQHQQPLSITPRLHRCMGSAAHTASRTNFVSFALRHGCWSPAGLC